MDIRYIVRDSENRELSLGQGNRLDSYRQKWEVCIKKSSRKAERRMRGGKKYGEREQKPKVI